MNYYQFHIGDFRSGTVNMTRLARWIYRDMMDVYYDLEKPLPLDLEVICEQVGATDDAERVIVERHLRFKFIKCDDGYRHKTCDRVISEYHKKSDTAKENGKLGGRPAKDRPNRNKPTGFPSGSDLDADGLAKESQSQTNHEPGTMNQEPSSVAKATADGVGDPKVISSSSNVVDMAMVRAILEEPEKQARITDPQEIIYGYGVPLLVNAGSTDKHARSFLGRLRKDHGDTKLIDTLRDCIKARPLEPTEWMAAALPPPGKAAPRNSRHTGFDKLDYNEGINADGTFD